MSIYRIHPDYDNYLRFTLHPYELQAKMGEDFLYMINRNPQAQPDWVKPDATFWLDDQEPSAEKLPDISYWTTSHPVFNQKAYDALASHLEGYGEFLPVNVDGKPYYIFNVLKVLDESFINSDMSEREFETMDGFTMQTGLNKLRFNEERLENTLVFKIEYDTFLKVYCNDGFKRLVENAGLTGILFKLDLASVF